MKYLRFKEKVKSSPKSKEIFWWNLLWKILALVFPKANPDYDHLYSFVETWYIEYDETCENDGTVREVGKDTFGRIIVKAPDNRNYGFWNDTNMNINDFINHKSAEFISKEEFESVWNEELVRVDKRDFNRR